MDIHQSNCKVLGLTLPPRAGWSFQAVLECVYSKFFGSCKFYFTQVSLEKFILRGQML